jgi:hypothetical protein
MAVMNSESLVLCGVAVLVDGRAVNLRRGTGYTASKQKSATCLTMRHPSPNPRQRFNRPAGGIEAVVGDRGADARVGGAGRSPWRAGVSAVRSSSIPLDAPLPRGWANLEGEYRLTVAADLGPCQAPVAASVGEAPQQASSSRSTAWRLYQSGAGQAPSNWAGRLAMASSRRD